MIHVIILAAGKGTRMKSEMPKVLHPVKGTPIIKRLLESIEPLCEKPTLIVGHKAEDVISATEHKYHYILQGEQHGTGHAIMCAEQELKGHEAHTVIVLPGDHPMVTTDTLHKLVDLHEKSHAVITMATTIAPSFEGQHALFLNYGRVIRGADGTVDRIVEYKDATEEERACTEVNLSYYCFNAQWLWDNINKLKNNNAANEYYLTDLVQMAKQQGKVVAAFPITNFTETLGINTPEQLKMVEEAI